MFRLHDTTRRRIGLTAFLALCIAPTAGVLGWAAARHMPGDVSRQAEQLSQQLGLDVTLEGIRYPRPGIVLYDGLSLADPETAQPIAHCRLVEATWTRTTDAEGKPKSAILLVVSQPEFEAGQLDRLGLLVRRMLESSVAGKGTELRLSATELAIQGEESQTLADVECALGSVPGGIQAELAFHLADNPTGPPMYLRILRNRQVSPPANAVELNTGDGDVPCALFASELPLLKPLGLASRFRGYFWANQTPTGWEGEAHGQLLHADLTTLVSDQFPHKLSGLADITLDQANFRRGRLEAAQGTVAAGPGVVGRSLIEAATTHLAMTVATKMTTMPDFVAYRQLAARFSVDVKGLHIQGECENVAAGTLLRDNQEPLLVASGEAVPVVAILRLLVPASEVQVPATRQTDWLASCLPIPDLTPPGGTSDETRHLWIKESNKKR